MRTTGRVRAELAEDGCSVAFAGNGGVNGCVAKDAVVQSLLSLIKYFVKDEFDVCDKKRVT